MAEKLTKAQIKFLTLLAPHSKPVTRKVLPLADREEDRVRQSCKRAGLAEFVGGWNASKHEPFGWRLTDKGRAALAESAS